MKLSHRPYSERAYIKWYVDDSPGWLLLSLSERGLAEGLARKATREGYLHLSYGLEGLAVLLRVALEELEPALAGLVRKHRVAWTDEETLFLPGHEERQSAVASATQRSRSLRERNAVQRRATRCNAVQRDETDATIRSDQIRSDQNKPQSARARGVELEEPSAEPEEKHAFSQPVDAHEEKACFSPRARALPPSEQALQGPVWAKEYRQAIEAATGHPWMFPLRQLSELRQAIEARCPDRAAIVPWIRETATDFAQAIPPERVVYWSGLGPSGLVRWLNAQRPSERAGPAPKALPVTVSTPPEVTATDMARWRREKAAAAPPPPDLMGALERVGGRRAQ